MSQAMLSFLEALQKSAAVLEEVTLTELIDALRQQIYAPKLSIMILGSPGVGRHSLANVLLRGNHPDQLLPVSAIPKPPVSVVMEYGEDDAATVTYRDGTSAALPVARLRELWFDPEVGARNWLAVEMRTRTELLQWAQLRVESIESGKTDAEWKRALAGVDYTIMVLNATALLSERERLFIRNVLHQSFGLSRVAILINQMDLIPEGERDALPRLVRSFLGSFESQPVLVEFSAVQAEKDLESGSDSPDSGYRELLTLVNEDLVENHHQLRLAAIRQTAEACIGELERVIARQEALLSGDAENLKQLLERLSAREEWVETRIRRLQGQVEASVGVLLKEQLLRDIEGFAEALRQQLPHEITGTENLDAIRRHLPGYIEALWLEFFEWRLPALRETLERELLQVQERVEEDLEEVLGGGDSPVLQILLPEFGQGPDSVPVFIPPRRARDAAGTTAAGLQYFGVIYSLTTLTALSSVLNPQVGLLSLAAGQAMRVLFKEGIARAEREAIAASAIIALGAVEGRLKEWVRQKFAEMTEEINESVAESYERWLSGMRSMLEEDLRHYDRLGAEREQVEDMRLNLVPSLRQLLTQALAEMTA